MGKLEKYMEQYDEFTKITTLNLDERAKRVPAEKHFWTCALIQSKKERYRLLAEKKRIKDRFIHEEIEKGVVALTKKSLEGLEIKEEILAVNDKIQEMDFLIEYLENVHKHVTFIGNDIRNIILIEQLQQ